MIMWKIRFCISFVWEGLKACFFQEKTLLSSDIHVKCTEGVNCRLQVACRLQVQVEGCDYIFFSNQKIV